MRRNTMNDDSISRQETINIIAEWMLEYGGKDEKRERDALQHAAKAIKKLPSITPEEVIRCQDCEWWNKEDDSLYGYCMAMKHGFFSDKWEISIYRRYKGDFYCADAERRTDEKT